MLDIKSKLVTEEKKGERECVCVSTSYVCVWGVRYGVVNVVTGMDVVSKKNASNRILSFERHHH